MNVQDALSVLGLGDRTNLTINEVKKAYRIASKKYHPDRNPAGGEMMKLINVAYDSLKKLLENTQFINNKNHDSNVADYGEEINTAINAVIHLSGIIVEICGSWVYLSGETKPHKDIIKKAGFKWASKKQEWFYRPANKAGYRKKSTWSKEKIRDTFGSVKPSAPTRRAITA